MVVGQWSLRLPGSRASPIDPPGSASCASRPERLLSPRRYGPGAAWVAALRRSGENVPRAVAFVVWLVGVISLISALLPAQRSRLAVVTEIVGDTTTSVAAGTTAAVGIAMMLLAGGLHRRQRSAWAAGLALSVAATALHLLKGLDVEEAAISAALAVVLGATRHQFRAHSDGGYRPRRMAPIAGGLLLVDLSLGLIALVANGASLVGDPSFAARVRHVLLGLVGGTGELRFSRSRRLPLWRRGGGTSATRPCPAGSSPLEPQRCGRLYGGSCSRQMRSSVCLLRPTRPGSGSCLSSLSPRLPQPGASPSRPRSWSLSSSIAWRCLRGPTRRPRTDGHTSPLDVRGSDLNSAHWGSIP